VAELPLYKAMDEASSELGERKGGKSSDNAPETTAKAGTIAEKFLAGKLSPEERGKFEALAEIHGFADGDDLAQHMIIAEEGNVRAQEVKNRVDAAMAEHGDLMNSEAIRAEAMKAVHGEKMTELLALEREALAGLVHNAGVSSEVTKRNRMEAKI